jgi:hypothetical protein
MTDRNGTYLSPSVLYNAVVNPAPATYFSLSTVTEETVISTRYYQRVLSSGLGVWCYYSTLNAADPSPSPNATSPAWTGSISNPQVIATALEH